MHVETLLRFDHEERRAFRVCDNWIKEEDGGSTNRSYIRAMARDGRGFTYQELEWARQELADCRGRLLQTDLTGLPAGLVAEGADLRQIGDDIYEVCRRETDPAWELLETALRTLPVPVSGR